ncbi:MAG TPA: hypothetical protein VF043_07800 [Ktedonobacteraceae bacterium]
MQDDRFAAHNHDARERELTAVLQGIFDTRASDMQSLARIRERLLEAGSGPLPVTPLSITGVHHPSSDAGIMPVYIVHALKPEKRTWKYYLSTIAAVFLVGVLISSLVVVLHLRQGSQLSGNPFASRPGWKQLVFYSGTGNKTITGLKITLPQLYGYTYNCVGSGSLSMKLTGQNTLIDIGQSPCQPALSTRPAPGSLSFNLSPLHIQTITVNADGGTSWFLLISEPKLQPALISGAGWATSIGVGGDTNSVHRSVGTVGSVTDSTGHEVQPKTWGIVMVCIGTAKGTVQLAPNVLHTNLSPCDGQPRLVVVHNRFPTVVTEVQVMVTGNIIFCVQVLGCVNENQCGNAH